MNPTTAGDTIVQEIAIQGTAERIFDALADPQQRVKWWSAAGRFHVRRCESDLRPGGKWMMSGDGMEGRPFTVRGEYREIERPRLLAFTWLPDWQGDDTVSLVRIEMEEKDGVTAVRLTHSGLATEISRNSHRGWPLILGLLQAYVERQA